MRPDWHPRRDGEVYSLIPIKDSNPTERFPIITVLLIVINVVVYLYELSLGPGRGEALLSLFSLVPNKLFHGVAGGSPLPPSLTVVTSMFLHGGILHLGGNMLYLWIFGNNVEDSMGRMRFLFFYLLCGVLAALGHGLTDTRSGIPMIGASGAISGVLGAYLLLFPRARVLTLFTLGFFIRMIELPAMVVLGFWFLFQFLSASLSSGQGGGIAWYAHLGGFVVGIAMIGIFKRRDVPFWGRGGRYYS